MSRPEWLEEAQELRERGLNYSTIAKRLGVPYDKLYHQLNREKALAKMQAGKLPHVCTACGETFMRRPDRLEGSRRRAQRH